MSDTSRLQTFSSFRPDKYGITVGYFRAFVNAHDKWRAERPMDCDAGDPNVTTVDTYLDATLSTSIPASASVFKDVSHLSCDAIFQTWMEPATLGSNGSETKAINCVDWYEAAAFCLWDGGWLPTEAEWMYAAAGGSESRTYPWSNSAASQTINANYANYNGYVAHVTAAGAFDQGKGRWRHECLGGNVWE